MKPGGEAVPHAGSARASAVRLVGLAGKKLKQQRELFPSGVASSGGVPRSE